jgi:putative flippase GtrA
MKRGIKALFWNKNFFTYTWVGLIMVFLQIFALWLLIDIFKIPTIISSIITIGGIFIIKFIIYDVVGFTK